MHHRALASSTSESRVWKNCSFRMGMNWASRNREKWMPKPYGNRGWSSSPILLDRGLSTEHLVLNGLWRFQAQSPHE